MRNTVHIFDQQNAVSVFDFITTGSTVFDFITTGSTQTVGRPYQKAKKKNLFLIHIFNMKETWHLQVTGN